MMLSFDNFTKIYYHGMNKNKISTIPWFLKGAQDKPNTIQYPLMMWNHLSTKLGNWDYYR